MDYNQINYVRVKELLIWKYHQLQLLFFQVFPMDFHLDSALLNQELHHPIPPWHKIQLP